MSTDDTSPLSRAILAATDRKRVPWVYRPESKLTPSQQWEQKVCDTLALALDLARARKALAR